MRPRTLTESSLPLRLKDQLSRPKLPGPKMQSCPARSAGVLGAPRARKIGGGGDQHALQRHEFSRAEDGVLEVAEPDRDIGAFGDQILPRIDHRHLDPKQRMQAEKFWKPRNDLARTVHDRDREPDGAPQRVQPARCILGILDVGQYFASAVEEQRAGVGDRDAAGGAQEQRHAEPRLQIADDARYRWLRQPEFAPRARKAAALRRAHENRQFLHPVTHLYSK